MIQKFLNNYFGFNKQQRNGFYILCCVSVLLLLIRISYPSFITPSEINIQNLPLAEEEIDTKREISKNNASPIDSKATLFVFDPNTVSAEELIKLGFRDKTAQTLIKFRSRGFTFKQKEDLKKIYGVSDKLYARLAPYVIIKTVTLVKNTNTNVSLKTTQAKLELNTADSLQLITLKGVGPGYAKRILKYRTLLGGFVSMLQLKEVYGMTDELYTLIESQSHVNPNLLTKININMVDFKTLNKHPYVSYELTKQIFNYRKTDKITQDNLQDVIQDEELVTKLAPYLQY